MAATLTVEELPYDYEHEPPGKIGTSLPNNDWDAYMPGGMDYMTVRGWEFKKRRLRGWLKPWKDYMECPLTKMPMKDPVKAEDSKIVYEREAIENLYKTNDTESLITDLVSQKSLQLEIKQFLDENISALHMACGFGDVEAVKKMVHKTMSSESLNRMDLDRKTPLEYALAIKHKEIIGILRDCDNIVEDFGKDSTFENSWRLLKHQLRMRTETDPDHGTSNKHATGKFREYQHNCSSGLLKPWTNRDFSCDPDILKPLSNCSLFIEQRTSGVNLQCPLSCSLFVDPVIAEDGYSYSRIAIQHWFDSGMTLSPLTNERMSTKLEPNVALRSQTADWFNENRSPIHMACIYGDLKAVQQLVKKDSNTDLINFQDGLHDTPLELAARYGSTEIVRLLLTCEHVTVSHPAPTIPAQYIALGLPLPPARYNAMYWAARHGHVNIVSMLLDDPRSDANLVFDRWGRHFTAFAVAVYEGHEDVTQLMLSHDLVDVNLPLRNGNGYWGVNSTALHLAAVQGHTTIIEMFLQEKLKNKDSKIDLNPVDDQGWTPFHRAVERGQMNAVRAFWSVPALVDINRITNTFQDSPLHTAADGKWVSDTYNQNYENLYGRSCSSEDRVEMISVLLGNENTITTEVNHDGNTALLFCLTGHSRCCGQKVYEPDLAASMGLEFLKRGVGAKVSKWFDSLQWDVRVYLYIKSFRLQQNWQKPMIIFHLSLLSAANHMNQNSSLNVFSQSWPRLVGKTIEDFLFPQQEIRTEFKELIHMYKSTRMKLTGDERDRETIIHRQAEIIRMQAETDLRKLQHELLLHKIEKSDLQLQKIVEIVRAKMKKKIMTMAKLHSIYSKLGIEHSGMITKDEFQKLIQVVLKKKIDGEGLDLIWNHAWANRKHGENDEMDVSTMNHWLKLE
jgi:ankyrin repeat protein